MFKSINKGTIILWLVTIMEVFMAKGQDKGSKDKEKNKDKVKLTTKEKQDKKKAKGKKDYN